MNMRCITNNKGKKQIAYVSMLALILLLFCGCSGNKEEEIVVTDYKDGVYKPADHHYILTLPSADWVIDGEENATDIVFTYKKNAIQVQNFLKNVDEMVESLPKEQEELEQNLKNEGYLDCQVEAFESTVAYENDVMTGEIRYAYLDYESGMYTFERDIYVKDELFILSAISDSDNYIAVQNALDQFEIVDTKKETDAEKESIVSTENKNVYTSYDGMYTLTLPYDSWSFSVNEETKETTLSSENKTLTVTKLDGLERNNAIEYEVPRTLFSLNKQIENLNLGEYKILSFEELTVDAVSDIDARGNHRKFYYLLELKDNPDGCKYYSYYEYRNDDGTYKIVGKTNSPYLVDSRTLLDISKSFSLQ